MPDMGDYGIVDHPLVWGSEHETVIMKQPPEDVNRLAAWLKPLLKERGWSIEVFAAMCQVPRSGMYAYLRDTNRPSRDVMKRMCAALKVPLREGLAQYTPKKQGRPKGSTKKKKMTVVATLRRRSK